MDDCTVCNLCSSPKTFGEAAEVGVIPCHVRCFRNDQFTVWRCSNCGSLHSKEGVDLPYYYERYPFKYHQLDFHTRNGYRKRLELLTKWGVTPDQSVLDFGCGQGLFVQFLRGRGFAEVSGYDSFIPAYSSHDVLERRYDVVVSYDVIEHVEQPKEFFETLVQLVKPGGLVVLGTPDAEGLTLSHVHSPDVELSQPYHRHILSRTALLEMAGSFQLKTEHEYRRSYFDTWVPMVNLRFMWAYINATGGMLDVAVEPIKFRVILRSPKLICLALFGRLLPARGNILMSFRKPVEQKKDIAERRVANE